MKDIATIADIKSHCIAKVGYSTQELLAKVKDTVLSKWLIWLVCVEPLVNEFVYKSNIYSL